MHLDLLGFTQFFRVRPWFTLFYRVLPGFNGILLSLTLMHLDLLGFT